RERDGDGAAPNPLADLGAAADPVGYGRRPEDGRGGAPAENLEQLPLVAGAAGMPRGALPGRVRLGRESLRPGEPRPQAPRTALAELVPVLREDAERGVRDLPRVLDPLARLRLQPHALPLDARAGLEARIVLRPGLLDRLG